MMARCAATSMPTEHLADAGSYYVAASVGLRAPLLLPLPIAAAPPTSTE